MQMQMRVCEKYQISYSEFLGWDDDDQDLAIAYEIFQADKCGRCGTSRERWESDRFAYEPVVERCRGCEMMEKQQQTLTEQRGTEGMYVVMQPSK